MDPIRTLKKIPLLAKVSDEEIREIYAQMTALEFPAGTVILEERGQAKGFFLMTEGSVRVVKNYGHRMEKELNVMSAGSYFGIMSLLDGTSPSATVEAVTGVKCLVLDQSEFTSLVSRHPSIGFSFLNHLSRRLRHHEETGMREMLDAQEAVMISLARLTEYRDENTGAHIERIRHYCRFLAEAAAGDPVFREEVDEEFISWIFLASPLHDIGKVGIPDDVLLKPGRLTREEYEVMKKHPAIGAEAIREAMVKIPGESFLSMACDIALGHHECVDGSGYPQGLKKDEIPLSAQIMALADVYDALRSTRVYRASLSHEETRRIMLEGRGTQFDGRLLDIFLTREDEFIRISGELMGSPDAGR
jgi:HD-GYP domain-containing protein (c-di-GMP phosphodiesterase class II)